MNCICLNVKSVTNHNWIVKLILILPYIVYICYFITGILAVLGDLPYFDCAEYHKFGTLTYSYGKHFIYQFFYGKLYIVYSNPFFNHNALNVNYFLCCSVTIGIYFIATSILLLLNYSSQQLQYGCLSIIPRYLLGAQIFLDQIILILAVYLFINPLKRLIIISTQNNSIEASVLMILNIMIIKNATLIMVIIFTTTFTLIFILITGLVALGGNVMAITFSICSALMYRSECHEKIFKVLCCGASWIVQEYCYKWCVVNERQNTEATLAEIVTASL